MTETNSSDNQGHEQTQQSSDNNSQTKKNSKHKITKEGDFEFRQLEPGDLKPLSVIVQAVDNQWLPLSLLPTAFKNGKVSGKLEENLHHLVRSEYIRSLINGEQVIINRAFIYNNIAISRDYIGRDKKAAQAFKSLLEDGVITLYLLGEQTPADKPISRPNTDETFHTHDKALTKWQQICSEICTYCVRISWDDEKNAKSSTRLLNERFTKFALSAQGEDLKQYLYDIRRDRFPHIDAIDPDTVNAFRQRLRQVAHKAEDFIDKGKYLNRNEFYNAFITAGENPSLRLYDQSKPFAEELKLLFDLAYNCNLPDALGGYLITPVDSPPRTALNELKQLQQQNIDGKRLVRALQNTAFALVNQGLNLPAMSILSLQDVYKIRHMDEWKEYIQQMQALLDNPFSFITGATDVFGKYTLLAERITDLVKDSSILTKWEPCMEIVFTMGSAILSCLWTPHGVEWHTYGEIAMGSVPVVGRLVIRNLLEKKATQDLSNSIDFIRGQMSDAKEQWKEIVSLVKTFDGYSHISEDLPKKQNDPVMSFQLDY